MSRNIRNTLIEVKTLNRLYFKPTLNQIAYFSSNLSNYAVESSPSTIFNNVGWVTRTTSESSKTTYDPEKKLVDPGFNVALDECIEELNRQDPSNNLSFEKFRTIFESAHQVRKSTDAIQMRLHSRKIMAECSGNTKLLLKYAQVGLALSRQLGHGAKDVLSLFKIASLYGKNTADYVVASLLYDGYQGVQDQSQAYKLMKNLADKGLILAIARFGIWKVNENDLVVGFKYLEKAAKHNSPHAHTFLGHVYWKGEKVPQDQIKAKEHFQKAADLEFFEANFYLGLVELAKENPDFTYAVQNFEKAASSGLAEAQFNLGNLYFSGRGVQQNFDLAAEYWSMATKQNLPLAMMNLGKLHLFSKWKNASPAQGLHLLELVSSRFPNSKFKEDASEIVNKYRKKGVEFNHNTMSENLRDRCNIL